MIALIKLSMFVLVAGRLFATAYAEFPDDPKPCKYEDLECKKNFLKFLLNEQSAGYTPLNMQTIDPLPISIVRIQQGGQSPLQIDLNFTNSNFYGLKNAIVEGITGFDKDLTGKHEVIIRAKTTSLVGDYSIQGKILILPISGTGTSNITLVNPKVTFRFTGTPLVKDGETYMTVHNMKMTVSPDQTIYNFQNLFNGDKVLGDNMNLFLNENWREIYQEAHVPMAKSFSKVFQKIFNEVFAMYPYRKYFAE